MLLDDDDITTTISRGPKASNVDTDANDDSGECCKCPAPKDRGGRNFPEDSENSIETDVDTTTLKMSTTTLASAPSVTPELETSSNSIDTDSKT